MISAKLGIKDTGVSSRKLLLVMCLKNLRSASRRKLFLRMNALLTPKPGYCHNALCILTGAAYEVMWIV
jgi:hypothetical protein